MRVPTAHDATIPFPSITARFIGRRTDAIWLSRVKRTGVTVLVTWPPKPLLNNFLTAHGIRPTDGFTMLMGLSTPRGRQQDQR